MKVTKLDHLVLTVRNIEETVLFYTKALGMEKVSFGDNRIALTFGNQKINLHEYNNEFEPKAGSVMPGSADLCFITNEPIADARIYLEGIGVPVIEGPVLRTGAVGKIVSIYVRDPDNNLVEISNYIANT